MLGLKHFIGLFGFNCGLLAEGRFFATLILTIAFDEDFFECCHANAVAVDVILVHLLVKLLEKVVKLIRLLKADLK